MRNAQLDLTKEQVKLQEAELELAHQLAFVVRDLETDFVLIGRLSIAARPPKTN